MAMRWSYRVRAHDCMSFVAPSPGAFSFVDFQLLNEVVMSRTRGRSSAPLMQVLTLALSRSWMACPDRILSNRARDRNAESGVGSKIQK